MFVPGGDTATTTKNRPEEEGKERESADEESEEEKARQELEEECKDSTS